MSGLLPGLRDISPLAVLHVAFFLVLVPWVVLRRARAAPVPDLTKRMAYYWFVCGQLVLFAVVSGFVGWRLGIPLANPPRDPLLGWGGAAVLVALFYFALAPYRRRRIARRDPRAFMTAPGDGELGGWALVSLCAGIGEELTYRSVASAILLYAGLPAWAVVLVVSASFGLAHATRGWFHVFATFAIGGLLHVLVLMCGSVLPAMAAHAVYDFFAGWSYGRLARQADEKAGA